MDYNLEPQFGFSRPQQQERRPQMVEHTMIRQEPARNYAPLPYENTLQPAVKEPMPAQYPQLKAIGPREWQVALSMAQNNPQTALAHLEYNGFDVMGFLKQSR